MIHYSAIIPVKDEAESLPILYKELKKELRTIGNTHEIIFIDDGSVDSSVKVLTKLRQKDASVKIIKFRTNRGKSIALEAGLQAARGSIIIFLDADLQDDPAEISKLLSKLNEGYDLVSGWRRDRRDTITKKVSSWLFNKGTSFITGVGLHDYNCGLKLFKREVGEEIYIRGELHRFIPILAAKRNFLVSEVPVHHRSRKFGKSKYGFERGIRGVIDLITVIFLTDYAAKPAHFFGKIGILFFAVGVALDGYVTILKIITGSTHGKTPMLLAGILFILLGVQLISIGLIAEMIAHYFFRLKLNKSKT